MKHSKQTIQFVDSLVSHYAKYDTMSDTYSLHVSDLPDFDQHELASMLMSQDDSLANEATGCDNPWYEKTMLPALLKYLRNSTDQDEAIEFNKAWLDGVTKYFTNIMQELINDQCNTYLHDTNNDAGFYAHRSRDNGEIYWSRHA